MNNACEFVPGFWGLIKIGNGILFEVIKYNYSSIDKFLITINFNVDDFYHWKECPILFNYH